MKRHLFFPSLFLLFVWILAYTAFGQGVVQPIPATAANQPVVQAVYSGRASTSQIRQVQYQQPLENPVEPLPIRPQPPLTSWTVAAPGPILQTADNDSPASGNVVPAVQPQFVNPNPPFHAPVVGGNTPAPLPQAATPNRPIASETVWKNYRLQNTTSQALETKLLEKLGQRFVPVRNVETTPNLARFRLPVKDGTDVELAVDRQNGIVTVFGSAPMVDACIQLVGLLDAPAGNTGLTTEVVPIQRATVVPVRQATERINTATQRDTTERPGTQPAPNFQRPTDEPTVQIVPPNANTPNIPDLLIPGANAGAIVGPIRIVFIEGPDIAVVYGPKDEVERITKMFEQMQEMSREYEPLIEMVEMKNADALRVSQIVQQLYQLVYQQQRGPITMLPLVKPNTIMLIGKKESIDTAKELIEKLDTPVDPKSQFRVIWLKNASAASVQTSVQNFYLNRQYLGAQLLVVSDLRTNSIILQGSERDLKEAEALVRKLDGEGGAINEVKTFQLRNATAQELVTVIQNVLATTTTGTGGLGGLGAGGAGGATAGQLSRNPQLQMDDLKAGVRADISVTAHTASNTLVVSAPVDSMAFIEGLIQKLDRLPSAESVIKVFTIANGDASTLMNVLQTLFQQTTGTGAGIGGAAGQTAQIATLRPGIDDSDSTLVSVRFATDTRTNSIVAIGSAGDMSTVEAILRRLDEENAGNRKVMIFKLVNKPAEQLAPVLQQYLTNERQLEIQNSGVYYPQSPAEQYRKEVVIVAEPLTNSLIVSSTPRYIEQIRKIVAQLDERPLMVAIQVLIAEVTLNSNRELGVELGLQDSLLFDRGILSGAAAGATGNPSFLFGNPALGLPLGNAATGTVASQGITSLGLGRTGTTSGVGGFTFAASSESVSLLIRALETEGKVKILSRPQISTLNNLRATIQVGQKVPYIEGTDMSYGYTTNSTGWMDVGVILDVTPRITPDHMVVMDVYAEKSLVGRNEDGTPIAVSGGEVVYQPKISLSKAQTTVSAMDGQTIVFAGLITDRKETATNSIPFFNKIPVVKHLFEYTRSTTERTEMIIILTPTVIRNEMDMELLKQQEVSRIHWCLSDVLKLTGNSNMRLRTDDWSDSTSTRVYYGEPTMPDESQLPGDEKIRRELPMPTLAPREN